METEIEQYSELSSDELIEKFTSESLALESLISQTNHLWRIGDLLQDGVNKELAIALENINPGCISDKITLNSFTQELSNTNYEIALEGWVETAIQIFMAIIKNWKFLIPIIIAFWLKFKDPFKWFSSTDNGSSKLTNDVINELEKKLNKLQEKGVTDKKDDKKGSPYIGELKELESKIKESYNTDLDKDIILKTDFISSSSGEADIKALLSSLKNSFQMSKDAVAIFTLIEADLRDFINNVIVKSSETDTEEQKSGKYKEFIDKAYSELSDIEKKNYLDDSELIELSKICRSYKLMGDKLSQHGGVKVPRSSKLYEKDSGKVEYKKDDQDRFWNNRFEPNEIIQIGLYSSGKDTVEKFEFNILHNVKNFSTKQIESVSNTMSDINGLKSKLESVFNELNALSEQYKKDIDSTSTIDWPKVNSKTKVNINTIPLSILSSSNTLIKNILQSSMNVAKDVEIVLKRLESMAKDKKTYADKIQALSKKLDE